LGSKDVDPSEAYLEWSVAFATGTLEARATRGGTEVSDRVQTAGAAARLALAADRASITADGRDLAFVTVDVVDAQGVVVPQASNLIDFAIEGPGELAGVDNGNAVSHESTRGPRDRPSAARRSPSFGPRRAPARSRSRRRPAD
jgi:beta-galactosidase